MHKHTYTFLHCVYLLYKRKKFYLYEALINLGKNVFDSHSTPFFRPNVLFVELATTTLTQSHMDLKHTRYKSTT